MNPLEEIGVSDATAQRRIEMLAKLAVRFNSMPGMREHYLERIRRLITDSEVRIGENSVFITVSETEVQV